MFTGGTIWVLTHGQMGTSKSTMSFRPLSRDPAKNGWPPPSPKLAGAMSGEGGKEPFLGLPNKGN